MDTQELIRQSERDRLARAIGNSNAIRKGWKSRSRRLEDAAGFAGLSFLFFCTALGLWHVANWLVEWLRSL
jgi:hypothetical protein